MFKRYYRLAKPGIVYGNVFTTIAGFLYASRWHIEPVLFFATIFGLALVIASAAVFNNYIDRDIDRKMERTRDRALVSGIISVRSAILYASALGLIGIYLLAAYVNLLTAGVAVFGFIFYVIIYGIGKRLSHWGTVVGSISGSVPILVGYTAVLGRIDIPAIILFVILALWQMPHFYAIAMYRLSDYVEAGIPVLPAKKGIYVTKVYSLCYVIALMAAQASLAVLGYAGKIYLIIVMAASLWWLIQAIKGFVAPDDSAWARKFFFGSLVVLVVFSLALSVGSILP